MSLAQFVRLCDGALSALSRRHSSAAAAVVFAQCRRGADERLSFESFVAPSLSSPPRRAKRSRRSPPPPPRTPQTAPRWSPRPRVRRVLCAPSFRGAEDGESAEFPRGSLRERGVLRERSVNGESDAGGIGDGIGISMSGGGGGGNPVDGTVPTAPSAGSALERSASESGSESSFASADRDGDGLLSPDEVVTALLGASPARSDRDDASDLVATLFEDVDLDRDEAVVVED